MVNGEWFDALQVQTWTADQTGALTFVNAFTAAYFGRSRAQLVGEGWQNVLPDGPFWLGSNVDVDAERRAEEVLEASRVLALRSRR